MKNNETSKENSVEKLFLENFRLVFRLASSFRKSLSRIESFLPITLAKLEKMEEAEAEQIELFIGRFSKLQDLLGTQIFRAVVMLDKEKAKTMRDVINKMEQKYVIKSVDEWDIIRDVRNKVTHEYVPEGKEAVEIINDIVSVAYKLLGVVDNIHKYAAEEIGLDMSAFDIKKLAIKK